MYNPFFYNERLTGILKYAEHANACVQKKIYIYSNI